MATIKKTAKKLTTKKTKRSFTKKTGSYAKN